MRRRMSADGMSVVEDSVMVDEGARRGVEEEEEVLFEVWREVRCPQDPSFGNFELSPG